jgi:transposase
MLPQEFPAWGAVSSSFREWQREGVWDQIVRTRRMQVRRTQGRDAEPSAAIIESQSITTSAVRGSEKGSDRGKKPWGRKRHALVDTQGNVLEVNVTGAEQSDQEGGRTLLEPLQERLLRVKLVWLVLPRLQNRRHDSAIILLAKGRFKNLWQRAREDLSHASTLLFAFLL